MLLVIMLNRSRFVYSVLHSLLSLFAFSLDHLTTTYAVSSRTARPNRSSLYHLTVFVFLVVTAAHTYPHPHSIKWCVTFSTNLFFCLQQRMEDLRAENIRLTHQLEASITEARRQAESQREKAVAKVGFH